MMRLSRVFCSPYLIPLGLSNPRIAFIASKNPLNICFGFPFSLNILKLFFLITVMSVCTISEQKALSISPFYLQFDSEMVVPKAALNFLP